MSSPALQAEGLSVHSASGESLVHEVDLELHPGRTTALVGPSGAGKSLTLRAVARLLPTDLRASGQVQVGGVDLMRIPSRRLRHLRGTTLGWISQDATASLNPTVPVSRHFTESLRAHQAAARSRSTERDRGLAALQRVGLENPDQIWGAYPFELSGGQAQRVAIALATLGDPPIVLADEVTAELDPVSQAGVLQLLRAHADSGGAVLLVTHDLAAAARYADQTVVLSAGRVLERGASRGLLGAAESPLTRAWARALTRPPQRAQAEQTPSQETVAAPPEQIAVSCAGVGRTLHGQGRHTLALDDVDLEVRAGEAVAVVGRSGSGKSTLVGVLAALDRPDRGVLKIHGTDVWQQPAAEIRATRRSVGLLFQDALSSFDPRYTVRQVVAEGLPPETRTTVAELLIRVGLDPALVDRRPVTLSGGQRQRVALARALAPEPDVLLADEPTSGLDILAQDDLVELLARARKEQGLTVVLVTHDLQVARQVADRVIVLDQGQVVDSATVAELGRSTHPVTRALLEASEPVRRRVSAGAAPHPTACG